MPHKNPEDRREYERRWRAANPDKVLAKQRKWRALNPEKATANWKRWVQENPEKQRARDLKWKREHPDAARAIVQRTHERHPEFSERRNRRRRARLAAVPSDGHLRTEVFERDGGICQICGVTLDPKNWHEDHIVPLFLGGPDTLENCQATCPTCNMRKGTKSA